MKFTPATLPDLTTFADVDFTVSIPTFFPEGTYASHFFIVGASDTQVVNVVLTVNKTVNISLAVPSNLTATTGSTSVFLATVTNKGNGIICDAQRSDFSHDVTAHAASQGRADSAKEDDVARSDRGPALVSRGRGTGDEDGASVRRRSDDWAAGAD